MARLLPKVRKEQILKAAVTVAVNKGFRSMTREDVANESRVSVGLVNNYFSNMRQLRKAVMRRAIIAEVMPIIIEGVVCRDPTCVKLITEELKSRAVNSLL